MSIDDLFETEQEESHPIARIWKSLVSPELGRVEFKGPSVPSGSAQLVLHINDEDGTTRDYKSEEWDSHLNEEMVLAHIKAPNKENEAKRFGYALKDKFSPIEARYGDGFFNAVLLTTISDQGFADEPRIREVMSHIHHARPYARGESLGECSDWIQSVLRHMATELTTSLKYDKGDAKEILIQSLAIYLDERFSVSARQKSGWI